MAVDFFLKIPNVDGESLDHQYKAHIEVLAWSWGMSQAGTMHTGSGGGAGKVSVQDFSITKYVDKSTPNIMQKCCTGKHYDKVIFYARKAGDKPLTYVTLTMEQVIVTSATTGGSQGDELVTENVTFNFAKFKYEYKVQDEKGNAGAVITQTFDIRENKE